MSTFGLVRHVFILDDTRERNVRARIVHHHRLLEKQAAVVVGIGVVGVFVFNALDVLFLKAPPAVLNFGIPSAA